MGSSMKYGSTMSRFRCRNSSVRMCSMLASDPVSRLSTQMTRWPRPSSSSHRCEPRNPAPPVTREVGMRTARLACARGLHGGLRHVDEHPDALALAHGHALALEPLAHDRAALAARPALAALLLRLDPPRLRHPASTLGVLGFPNADRIQNMPSPAFVARL